MIPSELDSVQKTLEDKGIDIVRVNNPSSRQLEDAFEQFIDDYGYDANSACCFIIPGMLIRMITETTGSAGEVVPARSTFTPAL